MFSRQTHDFRLNGEWEVLETSAEWKENTLACCPDTRYPYVEFALHMRRRQAFYVMNVIVPCSLLSVLVLIVFHLPPDAGEKISLGISVVLAIIVFLLTVAETIPRTSLHIPVMGWLIVICFKLPMLVYHLYSFFIIFLSIISFDLLRRSKNYPKFEIR